MVFEDRLTIETPEGVPLELTLAGVGSRCSSALIDYIFQTIILIALALVLSYGAGLSPGASAVSGAFFVVGFFLVFWGYDVAFEVLNSGQTPGKRMNGLRVVRESGAPVTFGTSAVRNVIRIIDLLPGTYLVGITAILVTRRNQRIGDLAAGTLVIREHKVLPPEVRISPSIQAPAWDTSAVNQEDLDAVAAFLARRGELAAGARIQIAAELAGRLRPKVGGSTAGHGDEMFLERLVAAKRGRFQP
ncbi:MAG TPA: RDD family protein [Gaiellaceae bacterium]|nr:RDD family protein [Gaiellaceae bacterium]